MPPPVFTRVKVDVDDDCNVTTFPAVPVIVHAPTVCVDEPANIMVCATVFVLASSVKVFMFDIVNADVPVAPPIVSLLYDKPPPINERDVVVVFDNVMFAVPLLNVKFVVSAKSHTEPVPVKVHVPLPICKERVFKLFELTRAADTLYVAASNVPLVSVSTDPQFMASASCTVLLGAAIVMDPFKVRPFDVIV